MKTITLESGHELAIIRRGKNDLGTALILEPGHPDHTKCAAVLDDFMDGTMNGSDFSIPWHQDTERNLRGFDFPAHLSDADVISEARAMVTPKIQRAETTEELARCKVISDERAAQQSANRTHEGMAMRLSNLERQFQSLVDGPAKRAMQSEIARIKNQIEQA